MAMHQPTEVPIVGVGLQNYQRRHQLAVNNDATPQTQHETAHPQSASQRYEDAKRSHKSDHAKIRVQEKVTSDERFAPLSLSIGQRFARNAVSWTCLLFTIVFFVVTILYACRPKFAAKFAMARSSSSRTIFALRLLSQVTEFLLAISLSTAFEKIQWHLIWPGGEGAPFATVSALVPGTGVWGLLQILFSKLGTHVSARCWSIVRLFSLAVVFALGVLIMSDVRTEVGFQIVSVASEPRSASYQSFNASSASMLALTADQIFGVTMDDFLLDPRRVIDITPLDQGNQSCSMGYDINQGQVCARTIFLPVSGGTALDQTHPEADLVVTRNAIGYQLEFTPLDEAYQFELPANCQIYGTGLTAFQLCLKSANDAKIAARLNYCANLDSLNSTCLSSTEWTEVPGWRTLMEITIRTADIAFSRRNDTIVSYILKSDKNPAPIRAEDLLEAYNIFVDTKPQPTSSESSSQDNALSDMIDSIFPAGGLGDISDAVGALVTVNKLTTSIPLVFHTIHMIYQSSSKRAFRGSEVLQNLLAIPIWYCSVANIGSIDLSTSAPTLQVEPFVENMRNGPEVYLAKSEHNLIVGTWTVLAYAALGGLAILFCFFALALATFHPRAARLPDYTGFPLFNFWRWNVVKGDVDPRASHLWSKDQRVCCTSDGLKVPTGVQDSTGR